MSLSIDWTPTSLQGGRLSIEVFWKEGFLGRLEEVVPKVKAMVKTIDKRSYKELRLRADEASLNLGRFVQYKKKNKP